MATPINQLPIEDTSTGNSMDDDIIMKEILSVQAEAAREIALEKQKNTIAAQQMQQQMQQQQVPVALAAQPIDSLIQQPIPTIINILKGDAKLIGLVFLAVIIAELSPIYSIISKYIALEKIPYHDILLKAAVVTIIVVFGQHFLNL